MIELLELMQKAVSVRISNFYSTLNRFFFTMKFICYFRVIKRRKAKAGYVTQYVVTCRNRYNATLLKH